MTNQIKGKPFNEVAFIMDYEGNQLTEDEVIEGFQHLLDSGTVWHLQGHYGRMAADLIAQGLIHEHDEPVQASSEVTPFTMHDKDAPERYKP